MKRAHHIGYRLLSGIKNGFILKFSQRNIFIENSNRLEIKYIHKNIFQNNDYDSMIIRVYLVFDIFFCLCFKKLINISKIKLLAINT